MAFSPGSNKNIILVNTSNEPKTIVLPLLSDYPDRFLYIKDVTTLAPESTYSNYITILTSNNDKFENEEGDDKSENHLKQESEIKSERDKIAGYNIKDKLNTKLTLENYLDVITKLKELLQDYKTKLEGLVKVNNKKIDDLALQKKYLSQTKRKISSNI